MLMFNNKWILPVTKTNETKSCILLTNLTLL